MDIVLVILRLLHIVTAFVWVGISVAQMFLIAPTLAISGESGLRFLKAMSTLPAARMLFPVSAGLTMLVGILLYLTGDPTRNFSPTGGIVLGIGAVVGIIAGIHGGAATGRSSTALAEAVNQYVPDVGQPIPADGMEVIRERSAKLAARLAHQLRAGGRRADCDGQRPLSLANV